mmetsp:Transcript_56713/g.143686  ORF Transcript_56713/g.143686 Transcript_56713/m.143686 type:complete len:225 (+) Transcript_56713:707-1381(+)
MDSSTAQRKSTESSPHAAATRGSNDASVRACQLRVASVTQQTLPQRLAAIRKPRAARSKSSRRARSASSNTSSKPQRPSNQAAKRNFDMNQLVGKIVSSQSTNMRTLPGICQSALEVAKDATDASSASFSASDSKSVDMVQRLPTGDVDIAWPAASESPSVLAMLMRRCGAPLRDAVRCTIGDAKCLSRSKLRSRSNLGRWRSCPEGCSELAAPAPQLPCEYVG